MIDNRTPQPKLRFDTFDSAICNNNIPAGVVAALRRRFESKEHGFQTGIAHETYAVRH